jgi:hypothetical protein
MAMTGMVVVGLTMKLSACRAPGCRSFCTPGAPA